MAEKRCPKTIFFDLDNTLFDHYHSLRCALIATQGELSSLQTYGLELLTKTYNTALEYAYEQYLDGSIVHADLDVVKIRSFFARLQLPEPSLTEVTTFRAIYRPAYLESRRETSGSIETLAQLREKGHRLAVVTNGQIEDQTAKVETIGIDHLVDYVMTSEEAGQSKPHPRTFEKALTVMGVSASTTYMVGDSIESDIKGAVDAGISAILYSPAATHPIRLLFETQVPVIRHMSELLDRLHFASP